MKITTHDTEIILDKDRAIYLPAHRLLVLSDLHLGKSAHFRRGGLPVPSCIAQADLLRLTNLLELYTPETLLITGDMFHHGLNSDIEEFAQWKQQYSAVKFVLVKGNHDLLKDADYKKLGIEVHEPSYCLGPFCFIHDAPKYDGAELYPISGHIHPGVTLTGAARQRMKFPCFYFGAKYAVLPAFSVFTGLANLPMSKNDRVFAITPGKVMEV
ncbi:MAG: ligase-associated DNA damage response endonuclease PdeM [Taibaiella sp.]|nr:ligase-associated DNA damage response endonuclease PdeM [Taibaiella sp.]